MKFLIILLSIALTQKSCENTNKSQEDLSIEYAAVSRGVFNQVNINYKEITAINKRGEKPVKSNVSNTEWRQLTALLKTIDTENLDKLEAPSKRFQFDGVAIATLTINYKGNTYKSPSFDHGNPPKEIAQLVNKILSISENIE